MNRLTRRLVVLVALALAGVALLLAAAPWVTATTTSPLTPAVPLSVSGHDAAPLVTAGALVVAAAALALTLSGRWAARAAGAVVLTGGVLVGTSAAGVLADPGPRAVSAATDAVGVGTLTDGPHVGAAVYAALVLGLLIALVGAAAVVAAGRWSTADTRHRVRVPDATAPPPADGTFEDQDAWDALSRGEDPS